MELQSSTLLIGRRDVAILPWVCSMLVALGLLGSIALRGNGSEGTPLVIAGAIGLLLIGAGSILSHLTPLGPYLASKLWPYVAGTNGIAIAVAAALVADPDLGRALIAANVIVGVYAGLVLPPRYAVQSLIVLVAATATATVLAGVPFADGAIYVGLPAVAWFTGTLSGRAHHRVAASANTLSSYDPLTEMLNRRGFTDRLSWLLTKHRTAQAPISLLILDLDGFKQVNDTLGHAAGDELLSWVGQQLAATVPEQAECGRMGGDEFAIALPGFHRDEATALAHEVRGVLAAQIGCSVGVATCEDPLVTDDDLFRVADAALYACKRDRDLGVQALLAGVARPSYTPAARSTGRAPLSYADVRTLREPPSSTAAPVVDAWLVWRGFVVVAASGAAVVAAEFVSPGNSPWSELMRILGGPWVLLLLATAWWTGRQERVEGRAFLVAFYISVVALAVGVSAAMLAHDGILAAIGSALFLKALWDATVTPTRDTALSGVIILAGWLFVAVLGSPDALWAVPFQLTLFFTALVLGSLGQRAFSEVSNSLVVLASTDALTGSLNRHGFERRAEQELADAVVARRTTALLAIDLDKFKLINDTRGHAAGDEVLRQVVLIAREHLPPRAAVGRIGGDEFAVLLPGASEFEARHAATELVRALEPVVGASIGHAIAPIEGGELEELQRVADRRSYEVKHRGQRRVA